jgi:hypothetical protein
LLTHNTPKKNNYIAEVKKGRVVGALPIELAATAVYIATCEDTGRAVFRTNKSIRKKIIGLWRIDVNTLVRTLVEHGLIDREDAGTSTMFYAVRNGVVELRKKKLKSLEELVTSVIITRDMLRDFCVKFREEAKEYIIKLE